MRRRIKISKCTSVVSLQSLTPGFDKVVRVEKVSMEPVSLNRWRDERNATARRIFEQPRLMRKIHMPTPTTRRALAVRTWRHPVLDWIAQFKKGTGLVQLLSFFWTSRSAWQIMLYAHSKYGFKKFICRKSLERIGIISKRVRRSDPNSKSGAMF